MKTFPKPRSPFSKRERLLGDINLLQVYIGIESHQCQDARDNIKDMRAEIRTLEKQLKQLDEHKSRK